MALPYRAADEANDRIAQTVIMYGDEPVYVVTAQAEMAADGKRPVMVTYVPLPAKINVDGDVIVREQVKKAIITDDKWRAHDLYLGYVNIPDTMDAAYVTRRPIRRYKQGLNRANVVGLGKLGNFQRLITNIDFVNMLKDIYPAYEEVLRKVGKSKEEKCEIAFARRWSLEHTDLEVYWLRYRGHRVASSQDGKTFLLPKKFLYLKELILDLGLLVQ